MEVEAEAEAVDEITASTSLTATEVKRSVASAAIGASQSLMDTESMQEAIAKIEEGSLCKIYKADMVFVPCSHMCCCMECTQAIRLCPLCRKPIEKAIKTYVA